MVVILMGVSGTGKTTLGMRLAGDLGWSFIDADDFHSPGTMEKMARGEPLSAEDIAGWMAVLRAEISAIVERGGDVVLAYSALTSDYREQLTVDRGAVRFVHLKGTASLVRGRLRNRSGHFWRENLLACQFATLQEPDDAVTIDVDERPGRIVDQIRQALSL